MAEILTGLREAKQKLSEEYAETNIRNRLANWISSLKKYGKIP